MTTNQPDIKLHNVLVLLSGGQDSTTALFWAKRYATGNVHALTVHYGQRHAVELDAAKAVAKLAGVASHEVLELPASTFRTTSPLVDMDTDVGTYETVDDLPGGIEPTFVPGRNLLFLSIAANRAMHLGCDDVVIGVGMEDFGGYPDCRAAFINDMESAVASAMGKDIGIWTPLMHLSKKATVELALTLPGAYEALAFSHTCYQGHVPPCNACHACHLRRAGFLAAGVADPLEVAHQ
jgi:7-cyano-7-deazaguanine synthase